MLHVTNGDCAAGTIRQAGIPGEVLSWLDVLHEGPVPAGLSAEAMAEVRAGFLAGCGWGTREGNLETLRRRDAALAGLAGQDEVVLWFEHDLFDQLQLIQILDRLAGLEWGGARVSLICIGEFPGIASFVGLGQLDAGQMASLFPGRHALTEAELDLGRRAWEAFTAPDPAAIEALLAGGTDALPFLAGALVRHLEQLPSTANGLCRTEQMTLDAVAAGCDTPAAVFKAEQDAEEAPFMGDASLWLYVRRLSTAGVPALVGPFRLPEECAENKEFLAQKLALTPEGDAVRAGAADWVRLNGIERWLGGVHLSGPEAAWRWDRGKVVRVLGG